MPSNVVAQARKLQPVRSMTLGAFVDWLEHNERYWSRFEQRALELAEREGKFSLYRIREDLRWEFKWGYSNNVTPYISRLLLSLHPWMDGMIDIVDGAPPDDSQGDLFS